MRKSLRALAIGVAAIVGVGYAVAQGISISGTNTEWRQSIFQVGMLRITREEALTATASGTITTAYQLTYGLNQVTTVASAGDAVKLPLCQGGRVVVIVNGAAANAMNIFPNSSTETINALSAGSAFSLAANKTIIAFCANDGKWYTNLTASLDRRLIANPKGLRLAA